MQQRLHKAEDALADIRKFLFFVLKYWYLVVLSVLIALGIAYFQNKYAHRVYPVILSLYVKEDPGMESSAAMLYANNPLIKGNPNYYNEPYLIKAEPVILQVVEKLNFHIQYFKEGRVKTTEIFPKPPITITSLEGEELPYGTSFTLQLLDNNQFYLKVREEDEVVFSKKDLYQFGEEVSIEGKRLIVNRTTDLSASQFINNPFTLVINYPLSIARSYANRLNISWTALGASLLDVTIHGTTPDKEILFLNTLAETYIELNINDRTENASRTIDFITDQLVQISDSLGEIEGKLELFKRQNLGADISAEAGTLLGRLNGLEMDKAKFIIEKKYFEYLQDYIKKDKEIGKMVVPSTVGITDPVLNSLVSRLIELQLKKNQMMRNSNTENPFLVGVNGEIADVKDNISELVNNLEANNKISQKDLNKRIGTLERELRSLPKAEREYINIKRMYDLSEGLYLFLMQKKAEAGIARASTTPGIKVVNPAKLAGGPISPNVNKNYIIAFAAGLGVPFGILFLFFYFNDKIRYRDDINSLTTIPFLGVVGHNTLKSNLVVSNKPRSAVAESFRSIRSNLQFFAGDKIKGAKTYLVTSSISGEGKTFCSVNLATVYAFSGKRTLIIGADLRKPKVFADFNLNNDVGLSNYLAGQVDNEKIIQSTSIQNLFLITGGTIPPNPSELLMSQRMKDLLTYLQKEFDVLILDTPPVGLVTDSLVLTPYVDHIIFVVRQNYTKTSHVKAVQEMYENGQINTISMLYNDLKVTKYGYNYGYGYGYGYGKSSYYVD